MNPVHIRAEPREFAESVLLPGDPRRARYIAENFFDDAKLVTEERWMLGYTGAYKGEPIYNTGLATCRNTATNTKGVT